MILRRIVFVLAMMFGAVTSQLPEYAQQYRQRLGGAVDELQRMLADFDRDAGASNMDREQGIARLRADPDPFVQQRGVRVSEAEVRATRLEAQLQDFSRAGSFGRLTSLAHNFDFGVAQRAYETFEPAVPLTVEGGVTAAVGFLAALLSLRFVTGLPARVRRRRARGRISHPA
ncbi:MAG: hypothetical protein JWL62_319 [Hyphomicrobiales bacterium]|nr:hypothetical protein [Hyphomicrobiales bacterium]